MLDNDTFNVSEFLRSETLVIHKPHWVKPEFGLQSVAPNMDMTWF